MTTVLLACDKFKGSATAAEVAAALEAGLRQNSEGAGLEVRTVPVADGGDGTVAAALSTCFEGHASPVAGPYGEKVMAEWAFDPDSRTAVLEIATACGLDLVDSQALSAETVDASRAGSRGVGQLMRIALDEGARRVVLGLGGSATTDGGAGMLAELGVRFLDKDGRDVGPGAAGLADLGRVDLTGMDQRLAETEIVVASDVANPLCGPEGAAAVYGPQKGLSPSDAAQADAALARYAVLVEDALGAPRGSLSAAEGAGAAGGLGFAASALLGGVFRSGAGVVLEMVGFDDALEGADLVVTGEGKLDRQTLSGKAPSAVLDRARRRGVPVVAVCGSSELADTEAREAGFERVLTLTDLQADVQQCLRNPLPLLEEIGRALLRV